MPYCTRLGACEFLRYSQTRTSSKRDHSIHLNLSLSLFVLNNFCLQPWSALNLVSCLIALILQLFSSAVLVNNFDGSTGKKWEEMSSKIKKNIKITKKGKGKQERYLHLFPPPRLTMLVARLFSYFLYWKDAVNAALWGEPRPSKEK